MSGRDRAGRRFFVSMRGCLLLVALAAIGAPAAAQSTPTPTATPAFGCPPTPRSLCDIPIKSKLVIVNDESDSRDKLQWKFMCGDFARGQSDFGDPLGATRYALCIYANNLLVNELQVGPDPLGWEPLGDLSFKYGDTAALADGVYKMVLKGGPAGRPKVFVKAKGANLPDPALGLTLPVIVQVINSTNTVCFEDYYPTADENDGEQFKAAVRR